MILVLVLASCAFASVAGRVTDRYVMTLSNAKQKASVLPCVGDAKLVDCRNLALREVPDSVPKNTRALHFDGNALPELHSGLFCGLPILDSLSLQVNGIREIEPSAFECMKHLRQLLLGHNLIEHLDNVTLPEKLINLDLSFNPLKIPSDRPFLSSKSLQMLTMNKCGLAELPEEMFSELPGILILLMQFNEIKEVKQNTLKPLKKLVALDVGFNQISDIESELFLHQSNIYSAAFSHNPLKVSNSPLLHSSSLRVLTLRFLPLKNMGIETFSKTPNIFFLTMFNCSIESISKDIFSALSNLKTLDMGNNSLTKIDPNTFEDNQKMEFLLMDGNPLELPSEGPFIRSKSITLLGLSHCGLSQVPDESLSELKGLETLLLENNNLGSMPLKAVKGCDTLRVARFNRNKDLTCDCECGEWAKNQSIALDIPIQCKT